MSTHITCQYNSFLRRNTLNYINEKQTFRKGLFILNKLKDKTSAQSEELWICQHTQDLFKKWIYEKLAKFWKKMVWIIIWMEYLEHVDTFGIQYHNTFCKSERFLISRF